MRTQNWRLKCHACKYEQNTTKLAQGDFDVRIETPASKNKNNAFYQEAQGYLAQRYSKNGDKEKATELYMQISKENGFYKARIKQTELRSVVVKASDFI